MVHATTFPDTMETPVVEGPIETTTPGGPTHKQIRTFGKLLSVVCFDGLEYLIGVQIATLLKRETFNMYRSMKIKTINIQRATPEQVEFLCKCKAVRAGTHSVTLIPYEAGLQFASDALRRKTGTTKPSVGKRRVAGKPKKITEDDGDDDDETYEESYSPRKPSSRSKPSWAVRRSARKPQWYTDYAEEEEHDNDSAETEFEAHLAEASKPSSRRRIKTAGVTKTIKKKNSKPRATLADLVSVIFEPDFYCELAEEIEAKRAAKTAPVVTPTVEMTEATSTPVAHFHQYQQAPAQASVYPQYVPYMAVNTGCATIVPRFQPLVQSEHAQPVMNRQVC